MQGMEKITPDMMRTPFVKQASGNWSVLLLEGAEIEFGHRFDAGIGYRVFIKYKGTLMSNVFPVSEARRLATMISQRETNTDILNLGIVIKQMANQCETLNREWTRCGAPDQPLDKILTHGNA